MVWLGLIVIDLDALIPFAVSLIALFGWLVGFGHIALERIFGKGNYSPAWILPTSMAIAIAFLVTITPWIPLRGFSLTLLGLLGAAAWIWLRPHVGLHFPKDEFKNPFFWAALFLLAIYGVTFIPLPDNGFDSLAYHVPFIHAFAAHGTIALPANPMNWTQHVFYAFPKGMEMLMGLWDHFFDSTHTILQFIILLHAVLLLNQIASRAGIKNKWITGALFLGSASVLLYSKLFFIEISIFLLIEWLILLLLDKKILEEKNAQHVGLHALIFFVGFSICAAKINAIAYLMGILIILYFHSHRIRPLMVTFIGGMMGIGLSLLPSLVSGRSFFDELRIAQALQTGIHTTIAMRADVLAQSLLRFLVVPNLIGLGLGLSALMFYFHAPARKWVGLFWGALGAFLLAFLASDLYILTYLQVGSYYCYAFLGLCILGIPLFLQFFSQRFPQFQKWAYVGVGIILVFGCVAVIQQAIDLRDGGVEEWYHYPDIFPNVPDTESTHVLMMNNINTPFGAYIHATVSDYTTYPRMEGDPCAFWKKERITHIVYWHYLSTTYQLDGGNPQFYQDALYALEHNTCTQRLNTQKDLDSPIVARVMYP